MSARLDTPPRQRARKDARLAILLPSDLKQRSEAFADEHDISVGALVRRALVRELAGAA